MNWYKIAQTQDIWYHVTTKDRLPNILKYGLKINSEFNKSIASKDYIFDIYGIIPIFMGKNIDYVMKMYREKDDIVLQVNMSGLLLSADIPSLTHFGAYIGSPLDDDGIWFEEGMTPKLLEECEDQDNIISYESLISPGSYASQQAIKLTKTAAYLNNIEPQRIKKL